MPLSITPGHTHHTCITHPICFSLMPTGQSQSCSNGERKDTNSQKDQNSGCSQGGNVCRPEGTKVKGLFLQLLQLFSQLSLTATVVPRTSYVGSFPMHTEFHTIHRLSWHGHSSAVGMRREASECQGSVGGGLIISLSLES